MQSTARLAGAIRQLLVETAPHSQQAQLCRALTTSSNAYPGFVELREYTLKPEGIKEFMRLTGEYIELRKQLLPLLGFFSCDTGGVLNRVLHLYQYDDFDHRDRCRAAAGSNPEWQQDYLARSRLCVERQDSTIFEPTAKVLAAAGAVPIVDFQSPARAPGSPQPVFELRRFQLQHGYDGLPLTSAYQRGITHKIATAKGKGQLLFFGHSSVGMLNNVLELWRYDSAQACKEARDASRANPEWRATIAACAPGIQSFSSAFLHAVPFSPMK